MGNKVKVVGYAKRVFYNNGIEYRNFSDDLVGLQSTNDNGSPKFTSGNFVVTTNLDKKPSKLFLTNEYTSFITLSDLKTDITTVNKIVQNNNVVKLNLNKSDLCNYAFFGSLVEYIRVSLENIIINWPASIKSETTHPTDVTIVGNTIDFNTYDSLKDTSTFMMDINLFRNTFDINYQTNGTIINSYNETNDLRNLTTSYLNYVVNINGVDFPIINFNGSLNKHNGYIKIEVKGKIINGLVNTTTDIYIKPNTAKIEEFFITLPDFESNLLNRLTQPKYSSTYDYYVETEDGGIIKTKKKLTWPTTDGYNIDFETPEYVKFVTDLLELAESNDNSKTNLVVRHLTSESISDFDTKPNCDGDYDETAGQKMNKTLKIYGRGFDEIKRHIDGISFANIVTYDKVENTPDIYLKNLGRIMGWELVSSVLENDLLETFLKPKKSGFSGHDRGLTLAEAEIELWRRIIMNTPWLWKSKGTRKSIEFLFDFIGTPKGLITFNEYIYKVKEPLDIKLFKSILLNINGDTSLDGLNIDSEGYPLVLPNTNKMYFQKAGLWYRETAGKNANVDILIGNNPHIGPYDGGQEYMNQFKCLIPNFEQTVVHNETISNKITNIFTNYNSGSIDNTQINDVWVDVVNSDNISLNEYYDVNGEIINDPKPNENLTDCGCKAPVSDDGIIKISIKKIDTEILEATYSPSDCNYTSFTLDTSGFVLFTTIGGLDTTNISKECCEALGFTYETGGINCFWMDSGTNDSGKSGCNNFKPDNKQTSEYIIWINTDTNFETTVVNKGCCEAYGYESIKTTGGYNCLNGENNNKCDIYKYESVNTSTGVISWTKGGTKGLITKIPSDCCKQFGYLVTKYDECIDKTKIEATSGEFELFDETNQISGGIINNEPSGGIIDNVNVIDEDFVRDDNVDIIGEDPVRGDKFDGNINNQISGK